MSSDEIYSLGLFTARLQPLQASGIMSVAQTAGAAGNSLKIQRCIPNLKSLAQVVVEILRSKRIGVTRLTFQGHVTSSIM